MHPTNKIATCCYCGTRAALVLTGEVRHELACASCGAPLHDIRLARTAARGTTPVRSMRAHMSPHLLQRASRATSHMISARKPSVHTVKALSRRNILK